MTDDKNLMVRPEFVSTGFEKLEGVVEKPLGAWERISSNTPMRRLVLLLVLAGIWEVYATLLNNPLLFPTFSGTILALYKGVTSGVLLQRTWASIETLILGYSIGLGLAGLLTSLAVMTRIGNDFLATLTAMFSSLPAIALLPMALLWFGLGTGSLVFVIVHSVLWPVALATQSGFTAVSLTLRMVGRNYGLTGLGYIGKILIPAAFPSILSGMKIGWAFAWRSLIAAELVFGVSSGTGGLGWYIYEFRSLLLIESVFAGLLTIMMIGLIVEGVIFATIEKGTVRKWGTQS